MFNQAWKLTVITEKLWCEKICADVGRFGGKGYTVIPAGGQGLHHYHPSEEKAMVVDDFGEVVIVVIFKTEGQAKELGEHILKQYFITAPGILFIEPVQVLRAERF